MPRLTLIIFLVLMMASASRPITQANHDRIRQLMTSAETEGLIVEISRLGSLYPNEFRENNYDYLFGRIASREGRIDLASMNFLTSFARKTELRPMAGWHMAGIARLSGNPMLERILLMEGLVHPLGNPYVRSAVRRTAANYQENGDLSFALAAYRSIGFSGFKKGDAGQNAPGPESRKDKLEMAKTLAGLGLFAEAREGFNDLINDAPQPDQPDDVALEAVRSLDILDGIVAGENTQGLSPQEHYKRGRIYQFNRNFDEARMHFERIINEHPTGEYSAEAVFQIGRGFSQRSRFSEAIIWYERLFEQFPDSVFAKDGLLQAGSAYAGVGKFKESIQRYQMFVDRYPNDDKIDRAYLNMIDVARDLGEETEAIRRARTVQEVFRGKTAEAQALFAEARILIAREEWLAADQALTRLEGLAQLGGNRVPGGTTVSEITFLRGYVALKGRDVSKAIRLFVSVPINTSQYYGYLATDELNKLAMDAETSEQINAYRSILISEAPTSRQEQLERLKSLSRLTTDEVEKKNLIDNFARLYQWPEQAAESIIPKPPKLIVRKIAERGGSVRTRDNTMSITGELLFLGLFDEAVPIMESEGQLKNAGELTAMYELAGRADRTIRFYESAFEPPSDMLFEAVPKEILRRLYPAPFGKTLVSEATKQGVDPRMLLSVIRQESRYDPLVKSNAAARGLMQFIPSTAGRIAGQKGLDSFRQDDLFDPEIAIGFGAVYVADLNRMFPNMPAAVAASYNGGEENMKRWLGRARSNEAGRYVPEIMYSQTKDYVAKVMVNFRISSYLYDEQLRER